MKYIVAKRGFLLSGKTIKPGTVLAVGPDIGKALAVDLIGCNRAEECDTPQPPEAPKAPAKPPEAPKAPAKPKEAK